jgi:hypothetical protein
MVFLTVTIINCHKTTKHIVTSNAFILVLLALQVRYIVESARGKIDSNIHDWRIFCRQLFGGGGGGGGTEFLINLDIQPSQSPPSFL